MTDLLNISLDDLYSTLNIGSIERASANNLFGINHRSIPTAIPSNKDRYGLTFLVRPQLNLTQDNIRNVRMFYSLLNSNSVSIQRYVRCMLDPRLIAGVNIGSARYPTLDCPLVDNLNAFIPVVTNNLLSMSGWPDLVNPTYTSNTGMFKESYSQVDGMSRYYETFDIDATFRNTRGDPLIMLFYIWCHYNSLVFEGKMMPYLDLVLENEIDYNTRIYRLVMDNTYTYVTKIGATGAAFPISVNMSSFFDFSSDKPYNDQSREISVRFRCMGAEYIDDVLIFEFNETTNIFNPNMRDSARGGSMTKVPFTLLPIFNNRGYPRINLDTYELEWYVPNNLYNAYTSKFLSDTFVGSDEEIGS